VINIFMDMLYEFLNGNL